MCVGKILGSSFVKSALGVVKKYPIAVTAGAGVAGLITYKAVTSTRKQQIDAMNRMILMNPFINPLGFIQHTINPFDTAANTLDGPLVKYIIDKNNQRYKEYYENLSPSDKVREFYKNGGKGVNFEA